ncbi:OLC1v1008404C1 [Oldenlandia corymbosa var. corymbosa]|uniref:OLC1v1008404C1 n=1 Tax=Oldenlandia corymbosa var. corymbosa TaxID=529605 RepID=A0AAV1DP00_OLDCO|nr:OLC1v1008404C1 [Oldenlandia corymbosa var. corymbosa]
MASSSMLILLASLTIVLFVSPTVGTSRNSAGLLGKKDAQTAGFRVTLKHVDAEAVASSNFTKFELLKRAMNRGKKRVARLNQMVLAATDTSGSPDGDLKSPIHAGNGEFLMEIGIGTPTTTYSAILDTGSDLIWTQCKPCTQCFDQTTPIFDPKKSSTYSSISCSSDLCRALPMSSCGSDGCEYLYSYGDYSSTQGIMGKETFSFGDVSVPNIGFGCGEDNQGSGFSQGAGLVGLGRGPLSLVSQLDEPKFSYCLTSIDDTKTSTLLMGSLAGLNKTGNSAVQTTPLVVNPSQPSFYYLSLQGITVGDTKLPIKKSAFALKSDGSGGMIIDSGTTITYLEESAFDEVKKAFTSEMNLPVDNSGTAGLDLCFKLPSGATNIDVPKLIFHFDGADVDLPAENYIIADSGVGLACLAMGSSSGMSIFGNVQQQNYLLLHDLKKETLSFLPTQCNQL